jgi:steroid 5-alpha reductase family enzyme
MFLLFFQAQALAAAVFALPFLAAASVAPPLPVGAAVLAVLVWAVAVGGEGLADRQLAAWRADPANRGRTCRRGLWAWSRHPNYFFEWLGWFTWPLLAWGEPWAVAVALLGSALMLATLLRGTGIPYTEQQALASRGDDYRRYQAEVSMFVPWPPKESSP